MRVIDCVPVPQLLEQAPYDQPDQDAVDGGGDLMRFARVVVVPPGSATSSALFLVAVSGSVGLRVVAQMPMGLCALKRALSSLPLRLPWCSISFDACSVWRKPGPPS